jgi:uncharacterized protein (DUF1501 family)
MALNRREFIRNAALGAAGATLAEPLVRRAATAQAAPAPDKTVVVVNLFGGNDGLNTVIPVDQYARYKKMRPTLGYDQAKLLKLGNAPTFAMSPGLASLYTLYGQGKVAVIPGVGVPHSASGLFDHSAQQYEFQSCDTVRASSALPPTGWMGRYLDGIDASLVSPGIDLGGGKLMLTGESYDPLTIYSIKELQLQVSFDATARRASYGRIQQIPQAPDSVAEVNRRLRQAGVMQSDAIRAAVSGYVAGATYPNSGLGHALQECAKLIIGRLGVCALAVGTGGFDTHSSQQRGATATVLGFHDELLKDVADSIVAFHADLAAHSLSDRVLILTMSEFGRTPFENSDHGTDHGYSSVAFAVGDMVKGGVYGNYPGLNDNQLVFYDVTDVTTDFRSLYATALGTFLNTDPVPLLGGSYPILGFL